MSEFEVLHERAKSFYETFERKADLQHQTHYCPGCGHGITHKLIARAIDELGIQDRTILVCPVGCSVFGFYYFDVGSVQAAHGRAPAAATAIKRSLPDSIVLSYQGDGDLAAIGTAEILHAANRGEPITVFFLNNAIYGMTGGQVRADNSGWREDHHVAVRPQHLERGLSAAHVRGSGVTQAPVYIERVALGNNKMIVRASRAIKKALENQVNGLGFSFIEVLSPCPTIWKMQPRDAQAWVRDELTKIYPLGVLRDKTAETIHRPAPLPPPPLEDVPGILGISPSECASCAPSPQRDPCDFRIRVAGFGGQGVLLLGELLAEAGLNAGLNVSWLPSYGPEMRSGTSNCHVRLATHEIDSPLVSSPNILLGHERTVASQVPGQRRTGRHRVR